MGFIRVPNEAMCRPIRALTQSRGFDTSKHVLACFGGAGGQHACSIARELGCRRSLYISTPVFCQPMALADVVHEAQEPNVIEYSVENATILQQRLDDLSQQCYAKLQAQGFSEEHIVLEPFLHLRYEATDTALMVSPAKDAKSTSSAIIVPGYGDFFEAFLERYQSEFGFVIGGRRIIVDDIRVRGLGKTNAPTEKDIDVAENASEYQVDSYTSTFFEKIGYAKVGVILSTDLRSDHTLQGPLILIDKLSTILIEPHCRAKVTRAGDLVIHEHSDPSLVKAIDDKLDAVQLSIFSHRFMSIAEQMGRILQRTS